MRLGRAHLLCVGLVLAVVGDYGMAIVEPLSRLGVFDGRLSNAPDDVFVGIDFLHFPRHDQNVTVFEKLHIVPVVVGTIPEQRAVFLNFDKAFVVVIGAIDVRFRVHEFASGNKQQNQPNQASFHHDLISLRRAKAQH